MAYTEYDYDTLAHFPSEITCTLEESHSAKRDKSNSYLGSVVTKPSNAIVNVEVLSESDADAYIFYHWFSDTLDGGTQPFTMYTEIFGRGEYYVLEITTDVSEKIIGGNNRKIKFTAEVLGISSLGYTFVSPMSVLSNGTISVTMEPYNTTNVTFTPNYFTISLDGVNYPVSSAVKENNILTVTPTYPITNYPTEVILKHTVAENGLSILSQEIPNNNSTVDRAEVADGTSFIWVNPDTLKTYMLLLLDKHTTSTMGDSFALYTTVFADGEIIEFESVSLWTSSTDPNKPTQINIILFDSRLLYKYEVVTVSFSFLDDAYIAPFTNYSFNNTSEIPSPEDNTMLSGSVSADGLLDVINMSIPQDRTYNAINFNLELDSHDYSINASVQNSGSLQISNSFIVTDYVTSVKVKHLVQEWGFAPQELIITNNSTTARISVTDAYTNSEGTTIDLILSRPTGRSSFDSWLGAGGILTNLSLTADGISVPLRTDFINSNGAIYTITLASGNEIYSGATLLLSYTDSTDIELAPFTNESVTNYSQVSEPMRAVSASTSTDGLTITAIMSKSATTTYIPSYFRIDHGYLTITPDSAEQIGTALTLTLPTAVRDDAVVVTNHTGSEQDWGTQFNIATTNNSTVVGSTYVSSEVVSTGTYLIVTVDETLQTHSFYNDGMFGSEFEVKVNNVVKEIISQPYTVSGTPYVWIYTQGIIINTDTVTVEFLTTDDPQIDAFGPTAVTNNSTETGVSVEEPPIYLMTEALEQSGGYSYLYNSSSSGSIYNGKLVHVGDGSNAADTPFIPSTAQYNPTSNPNGWIDLDNHPAGDGTKYIDTGWIPSSSTQWSIMGIYNLVIGTSYDVYVIHYKTGNLVDIYLGDHNTDFENDFPSGPTYTNIPYTPSTTETWKIYEGLPEILAPDSVIYDMSTFNTI